MSVTESHPELFNGASLSDRTVHRRAVEATIWGMPAVSMAAVRASLKRDLDADFGDVVYFSNVMVPRHEFLTANNQTPYVVIVFDLRHGPMVLEVPPASDKTVLFGSAIDSWEVPLADIGGTGDDAGKGGKYLFLPSDYTDTPPEGYYTFRSRTFGNIFATRGFQVNGDPKPGVAGIKQQLRIYPLAEAATPPATNFVNVSGQAFSTIHAMDASFFEEVNEVIQEEPTDAVDPETLGLLASIGIEKGTRFAPDARMKRILTEAASVGQATARALAYRCRLKDAFFYPDSAWNTPFVGGSSEFLHQGARLLDARSFFFFYATGITPAMAIQRVGAGSAYAAAFVDAQKQPMKGSKTYKLHLPPHIPAKQFWSLVLYDNQTRSMLQTDQQFPSISSQKKGVVMSGCTAIN